MNNKNKYYTNCNLLFFLYNIFIKKKISKLIPLK